jgi:hypothetical protein
MPIARARTRWWFSTARARSSAPGAKEFRGVAHGLHIRKEGRNEFLYLTVNAANPKTAKQPEMQAVGLKATPKGEMVWEIDGPPDVETYKPGATARLIEP